MPTLTLLGGPPQGTDDESPTSPTTEDYGDRVLKLVKKIDILRDEVNERRQQILQVMNSHRESHWLEVARRQTAAEGKEDEEVAIDIKEKEAKPELEAVVGDEQHGKDATEA